MKAQKGDTVKVYYKAGYPLQPNGNMFSPFESIIIRRAKVNLPIQLEIVSYRVSTQWESDANNIYESGAPNYYANPLGDKIIDYHTFLTYQVYFDKEYGNIGKFLR